MASDETTGRTSARAPATTADAESPAAPAQTRRYGHFEIAVGADGSPVELGSGRQSVTYRALDSVLHTAVALKVIHKSVAADPAVRSRFLREARAAAKIHHPNVASVSHYGEQDGECYYAMELVEGETIEAKVRREGPLAPALALDLGMQVARALAAAEACGVVHRDLKPANLMLACPPWEHAGEDALSVKVVDWGLARAAAEPASGADKTHDGFLGTPAFASPEQFVPAEAGRVDVRSDIYSLGVTLWYLLCGRTPFSGQTLEEIHARQVSQPLPVDQLTGVGVPGHVIALLKFMLTSNPALRPQSSRELLEEMRRCRERCSNRPARTVRRRRSLWSDATLGLLALVMVAAAAFWLVDQPAVTLADRSIAVLPFDNLSPDPAETYLAQGIQHEIIRGLERITSLKVVSFDGPESYLSDNRNPASIGRDLDVRNLLTGTVRRSGDTVEIAVRLIDTLDPGHPWTANCQRRFTDLFEARREMILAVAQRLRVPLSAAESNIIGEVPTRNSVAYDLYLRLAELPTPIRNVTSLRETQLRAVSLLDAAVARDPSFALAYCRLAQAHDSLYSSRGDAPSEERWVDHRAMAEAALHAGQLLCPDSDEVHLAAARHFFEANHDCEKARIELDLARRTLPNDSRLEVIAGKVASSQGRWEDALQCLKKAVSLHPADVEGRDLLASTYRYLRRYGDYQQEMTALVALLSPGEALACRPGIATISLERHGDLAPLRAALAALPTDRRFDDEDIYRLTLQLCDRNSEGILHTVNSSGRTDYASCRCVYPRDWYVALAARIRRDPTAEQAAFATARLAAEERLATDPTDSLNLSVLAMIDAGLGRSGDALREGRSACELMSMEKDALWAPVATVHLAVVYAWTGQPNLAITELEELTHLPNRGPIVPLTPSYGDLQLNPMWDSLRQDPRFAALVERLAEPAAP